MEFSCKAIHDRTYKIYIEWNLLSKLEPLLEKHRLQGPFYIISDRKVFSYHGRKLLEKIQRFRSHVFLIPPGEASKSLSKWKQIQDFLLEHRADRRSVVVAFGGGVVGDLAGFAASTYMRGLDFIQIPTTVLSQFDSSVGAKVSVNHPRAKNLIGSFYQPKLVLTDPSLLSTLSRREFAAGLGEAIKYGVITDPELFEMLYEGIEKVLSYNKELLGELITRCVRTKIKIVEEDERETGLRKILNFGHTVGHALEQATHYRRLRHGEAVAWGMLAAGWLAVQRGMWEQSEFEKLKSILIRAGSLYPVGKISSANVLNAMKHDKKKSGTTIHFVLPEKTGKVTIVNDISRKEVLDALNYIFSPNFRGAGLRARDVRD